MNDSTNYSYLEASAKRKKRNQFISILIIVAVVLAVVVGWGVREYNKTQDAERIKNALNSQIEPAFPMQQDDEQSGTLVDSSAMEIQDFPESKPSLPELTEDHNEMASEPPVAPVKQVKPKVLTHPTPKTMPKPIPEPRPKVVEKPTQKPAEVTSEPLAMVKPEPVEPKIEPPPTKAFAPEDMPMPAKIVPSDEGLAAVTTLAKVEPSTTPVATAASEHFKTGMEAYKQADYVNAIRAFAALSKPVSRKRGDSERDEYVQGNFLRGVALLKMQHISEAASAFQNSLEYEKYYPLANMNLGICYIELKQYAKAHKCFEAVIRDQSFLEPSMFDDVMQRTKYFWALAWTRLCKGAKDPDRVNYYRQQAILRWKDYQVWFSKNDKYKSENQKADNYLKSLSLN